MAAFHGRNGRLYVDITNAGGTPTGTAATPIVGQASWSVDMKRDRAETTAMGDASKSYVAGLPDFTMQLEGFVDDSSNNAFAIADGAGRMFYLYLDNSTAATCAPVSGSGRGYFYGKCTFDVSAKGGTGDAAGITLSGQASQSCYKV